jgi:1-aminocyclopropane-1-carboxylate deaminase
VLEEVFPARARTADGEERERLWQLVNQQWPDYDSYQTKTEREIRWSSSSAPPADTELNSGVIDSSSMSLDSFARVPLLFGPSPVHRLERLSEHLGGEVEIWAKREDCNSGLAYGGNKTRKLEYLVADALAQGCDTLVSIGGVQSNHTRQVAAVAAKLGLGCVLVQEHWVEWPDGVYDKVGNILLSRIMGADVRLDPGAFDIGIRPSWEEALASVEERGGKPYAIPAGASDHPLGGLGFARWAQEVADQEQELGVFFDTVITCSVTGSTQAGMIAGFALQDAKRKVLGVDGSATVEQTWNQIVRIARQTAEAIGLGRELRDDEIILLDEWHAGTYGTPDTKTVEAIRLCARLEGVLTDPVYEGKSMAALIDLVRSGRIPSGSRVLYAHLGGQPALNAYSGVF